MSAGGGDVTVLTRPAPARGELDHLWPEMLPGGRAVLFTITATTGGPDAAQVAVLDLATGTSRVLMRGRQPRALRPERASGLHGRWNVARRPVRPRPAGDAWDAGDGAAAAGDEAAGSGRVRRGRRRDPRVRGRARLRGGGDTLVWVDRQGREEPLGAPPGPYLHPRLSPDGMRVAVAMEARSSDIWVWDLARQKLSQLTFDPAVDFAPVWTPDGRRLLFFSPSRDAGLFWQPADGTGAAERLGTGLPSGVTPDGKHVLFHVGRGQGRDDAGTRRHAPRRTTDPDAVQRAQRRRLTRRPLAGLRIGQLRTIRNLRQAVSQRECGAMDDLDGRRHAAALGAEDGQELFYVAPDGALMAVRVDPRGGTWSCGQPGEGPRGAVRDRSRPSSRTYDVSPDGQRFLMVKQPANQAAAPQIIVVQNWFEELKRLVPVK